MATDPRGDVKYLPQHCPFLQQDVWAILTRQPDGSWRIVNCLDKGPGCYTMDCVFTTDGGQWPFKLSAAVPPNTLYGS